jgi:hypothetical protein
VEALAFQEAAGIPAASFFAYAKLPESLMRLPLLIAATVLLSACGNNDQTDKTQNADENLSAENIVANDVTAIDAVTGDAANMAADVNYEEMNAEADVDLNAAPPVSKPGRRTAPAETPPANAATINSL